MLESRTGNLSAVFGHPLETSADIYLQDGQEVAVLGTVVRCISVPGHTIGGMCYYFAEEHLLFTGDTLFASSVGRSDFPTGNEQALLEAIETKLLYYRRKQLCIRDITELQGLAEKENAIHFFHK